MPAQPPAVSRRTAIGGAAALTAVFASGCTADGDDGPRAQPSDAPTRRRDTTPDVTLARAVLTEEQAMLNRVLATVRSHPRLAGAVAGARAAHRAHVALLTRAVPKDGPSPSPTPRRAPAVPQRAGAALAALAQAEARLTQVGGQHAAAAQSGPFARVLASMAAAAAQQAALLAAAATTTKDRR